MEQRYELMEGAQVSHLTEQGQSAYSYEIRPEKRWIKVQGPELDIAVYVERADLKWEYPAGKPKVVTDLDADLEYRVFLAKRHGT